VLDALKKREFKGDNKMRAVYSGLLTASIIMVLVFPIGSAPFSVQDSNEFSITTNPSNQRSPAIYGNIVVWTDYRNGNCDIYGYDLSTKEEFQITTDPSDQENPSIYGAYVVWEDKRNDGNHVYGYNLLTHEEFHIVTGSSWRMFPAIYKDIVVWTDSKYGNSDIFGYNLSTHQEFQITTDLSTQQKPALYRNIVVWEDERHSDFSVYGYNLVTGREFRISRKPLLYPFRSYQYDPVIYMDTVIWNEEYGDLIRGYDLSTSEKYSIVTVKAMGCDYSIYFLQGHSGRPAIYENIVVWADCRYGKRDIFGYNLLTDQEFQVAVQKGHQGSPAIYQNIVVWEDTRNGDWDIYGTELTPPYQLTQFNHETSLYYSDSFWMVLFFALVLVGFLPVGRGVWYVKKFDISVIKTSTVHPRDFRRNSTYTLYSVLFILFIATSGFFFIYQGFFTAFLWFLPSTVWGFNIYWTKKIPYIRITDYEIIIFPSTPNNPTITAWQTILNAHIELWTDIPSRIELFLLDNKKIWIDLSDIDEKERDDFIQTFIQFIK
jgi:beta propeller repeat protein